MFHYTSWRFYAISGTNLLTRCHSASSLFSAVFVFQKSYTGNILGIGRNKFQKSYFFPEASREPKRSRSGATRGPHAKPARPRPWPRRLGVRAPWQPPNDAPSPIRSLGTENPKGDDVFPRTVPQLRHRRRQISGDRSLCSGTLLGRGSAPGAISIGLHRRLHRLH
jgi:hypothetical protein